MNESIFTDFTKESDSYFFGLLLTDGNVSLKRNTISLGLQLSDKHIIEAYRDYVGIERQVKPYNGGKSVRFCFNSQMIKERLIEQNLLPRKSTSEKLPKFDWTTNHNFWRGVIDGDGSLFYTNNSLKVSLGGSKELLEGFNCFCQLNCFTKPRKLDKTKTTNFFTMCFSGEEAMRIAKCLYENSNLHLIRKHDVYKKALEEYIPKSPNRNIQVLPSGRFRVRIGFNGKKVHIGTYDSYEEAFSARIDAEIKYQGKLEDTNVVTYRSG